MNWRRNFCFKNPHNHSLPGFYMERYAPNKAPRLFKVQLQDAFDDFAQVIVLINPNPVFLGLVVIIILEQMEAGAMMIGKKSRL